MKKRILILMMAGLLLTAPATVFAQEPTGTSNTVYTAVSECSDGGYWITTIEEEDTGIAAFAASTKKASKTTKYYNNVLQWYVTVNGTFSYVKGKSSACTAASVTAVSKASTWKISSKKASKSGSTATASATAKQYKNGIFFKV